MRIMRSAGAPSSKRMSPGCPTNSSPFFASQSRSSKESPCRGPTRSSAAAMVSAGVGEAGAERVGESILNLRLGLLQDRPYLGGILLRTVVNWPWRDVNGETCALNCRVARPDAMMGGLLPKAEKTHE